MNEAVKLLCGDAWHCDEAGYPLSEEEERSLIITRTALGETLVSRAIAAGYITAKPIGADEIENMQPGQVRRKRLALSRLLAMATSGRAGPRFRGFQLARAAHSAGLWANVRSFLGMARRLASGRA